LLADRVPASARSVLDIGCGDGTFCRFITDEARLVAGVDLDSTVLPPPSSGQVFALASAEQLPFADSAFDAVTMTMVLHHVDADRALSEAARVTAPGGRLLILGFGRSNGLRDIGHEVRDVIVHRVTSRRMQPWWEPSTVKAEPSQTWAAARATALGVLPGCSYQRLPMWRYLIDWQRPTR
jgi:ubiquinone/menaquinone biosynthesis C-methylase UbiE